MAQDASSATYSGAPGRGAATILQTKDYTGQVNAFFNQVNKVKAAQEKDKKEVEKKLMSVKPNGVWKPDQDYVLNLYNESNKLATEAIAKYGYNLPPEKQQEIFESQQKTASAAMQAKLDSQMYAKFYSDISNNPSKYNVDASLKNLEEWKASTPGDRPTLTPVYAEATYEGMNEVGAKMKIKYGLTESGNTTTKETGTMEGFETVKYANPNAELTGLYLGFKQAAIDQGAPEDYYTKNLDKLAKESGAEDFESLLKKPYNEIKNTPAITYAETFIDKGKTGTKTKSDLQVKAEVAGYSAESNTARTNTGITAVGVNAETGTKGINEGVPTVVLTNTKTPGSGVGFVPNTKGGYFMPNITLPPEKSLNFSGSNGVIQVGVIKEQPVIVDENGKFFLVKKDNSGVEKEVKKGEFNLVTSKSSSEGAGGKPLTINKIAYFTVRQYDDKTGKVVTKTGWNALDNRGFWTSFGDSEYAGLIGKGFKDEDLQKVLKSSWNEYWNKKNGTTGVDYPFEEAKLNYSGSKASNATNASSAQSRVNKN